MITRHPMLEDLDAIDLCCAGIFADQRWELVETIASDNNYDLRFRRPDQRILSGRTITVYTYVMVRHHKPLDKRFIAFDDWDGVTSKWEHVLPDPVDPAFVDSLHEGLHKMNEALEEG